MSDKKEEIKKMSFAQSVEQVKTASENYLSDPIDNGKKAFASLLYVVGAGNLEIRNKEKDEWKSAADNGLPAAFYVSGGGRMIFEFGSDLSDENKKVFQDMYANYGETQRTTSTHRLVKEGNEVKEIKTNGVGDLLKGSKDHFGLDLQIPGGNDHGHMYIGKFDGGMMIGIENVAPGEPGHEWWRGGASNDISAFGVEKFRIQEVKQKITGEEAYNTVVIPGKYNAMKVRVTNELVEGLKEFQEKLVANEIDKNLGSKLPAKSVNDFKNSTLHQTPEVKPSKEVTEPEKPKSYGLKRFTNIVSKILLVGFIIKPFQKELKKYGEENKVFKIQNKVVETETKVGDVSSKSTVENSKHTGTKITPDLQHQVEDLVSTIKTTTVGSEQLKGSQDKSQQIQSNRNSQEIG